MNVGTVPYAAMGRNLTNILSYAVDGDNTFGKIIAEKETVKTAEASRSLGNALWGRSGAGVDYGLADYVSGNLHCTLTEFTDFYEAGLQAKGLSKINYAELVKGATGFSDVFSDYNVITKVGNCNVSSANWQRNDFPHYMFFQKNTAADTLNNWKPSGPEPRMDSALVQRNLSYIGPGQMSIIIPEKLQEKMEADPAYAEEIYAKVAKWKTDYDRWDNATAASLGMNVMEHQYSKSYCLNLDEEGNVKNCVVTSSGRITGPTEEEQRQIEAEQAEKQKRRAEYMRMLEESSIKRAEMERKQREEQYDKALQDNHRAVSAIAAYEANFMY